MEQTVIDLKGIVKRFYVGQPNELEILHGIDLKVQQGEFVSVVGESGSGKSTLMNIIGALDRPSEGTYVLGGRNVADAKDKELSEIRNKKIGFVFQTYNLIPRTTALANVELPMLYAGVKKSERTARAKELLQIKCAPSLLCLVLLLVLVP
ncbi:MAG: ATP-binding cassette domain-containing protein [Lachnospiraceae bacterium]|nr:ATP-binding cassette domain-containing protein [Lachnospiraceae bacterium]